MDNVKRKINLPDPFADYRYVEMHSEREFWDEGGPYSVAWLDVEKVVALTLNGNQEWPSHPSLWTKDKYDFYIDAWNPSAPSGKRQLAHMPRIAIHSIDVSRQGICGSVQSGISALFKRQPKTRDLKYMIVFGNGRHRTEFFRAQGVRCLPFEVRARHLALFERTCSCSHLRSVVTPIRSSPALNPDSRRL